MRELEPHKGLDAARLSPKRNPAKVSGQGGVFSTQGPKKLEPISKLPTAVDRIKMSNDSAQGRAVGAHPGSFSGGPPARRQSEAPGCGERRRSSERCI